MAKKKVIKLGANNQHIQSHEPIVPEYERLRRLRIKENDLKMQALGLHGKARSMMDRYQTKKGNKMATKKNVIEEDEVYRPAHNSDSTFKMKKVSPKAMAMAMAFKKRQQGFQLASSPIFKNGSSLQQCNEFLELKSQEEAPLCYNVHGRSEEERLEITERCKKNKSNRQVGKEKNFMHTSGPRSFARSDLSDPSPVQMLIATRKEKLTKRKPGDLRDKLISELHELDSKKDVDTIISNIIGSGNKKKCRLNLHGRGVSSTQLKQKDIMKRVEEKHAKEVEAIQKDYEDKRQQDRMDITNAANPHMSIDLSMFGSLLLDGQSEKDTNPVGLLQLHSSNSTSK
ncbi:Homoserine kinase, partial [Bienertia sinuspersici]